MIMPLRKYIEKSNEKLELCNSCISMTKTINGECGKCRSFKSNEICPNCGRFLVEVEDEIAGKKTGHLFACKCSPKYRISIG